MITIGSIVTCEYFIGRDVVDGETRKKVRMYTETCGEIVYRITDGPLMSLAEIDQLQDDRKIVKQLNTVHKDSIIGKALLGSIGSTALVCFADIPGAPKVDAKLHIISVENAVNSDIWFDDTILYF